MKKLSAKVGSYQKDGQTKGKYVTIGVIMNGQHGEYALIDPTVNLAGVLIQQNLNSAMEGKQPNNSIMCSVFDKDATIPQQQQQQQYQQQPQQQGVPADEGSIPF